MRRSRARRAVEVRPWRWRREGGRSEQKKEEEEEEERKRESKERERKGGPRLQPPLECSPWVHLGRELTHSLAPHSW